MIQAPRRKNRKADKEYLAFIHTLPCICCMILSIGQSTWPLRKESFRRWYASVQSFACRQCSRSEAAHLGDRGLGQKAHDRTAAPFCDWHHRNGPESLHRLGKKFWQHWGLERDDVIQALNGMFEQKSR